MARGLQLADAVRNVNDSGNQSKEAGCDYDVEQRKQSSLEHNPADGDHLQNSRHFACPTRFHVDFSNEQIQNACAEEKDGIARDHENRKPEWEPAVFGLDAILFVGAGVLYLLIGKVHVKP